MKQYLDLMRDVVYVGDRRMDRTGVGTRALFARTLSFDVLLGFPIVTTKKIYFGSVAAELAGFLEGTRSAARMRELGTNIWDANANAESWQATSRCLGEDDMGRVYGVQWRTWRHSFTLIKIDQLREVVDRIRTNPADRRLLVTAWNPGETEYMCLPPCHYAFQFFVRRSCMLDLLVHMRSVDTFLGMPFDIASYALLLEIVCRETDLTPGILTMTFGDTHVYDNHVEQVQTQLDRRPLALPILKLDIACKGIDSFRPEHAVLVDYHYHPFIKANMAL